MRTANNLIEMVELQSYLWPEPAVLVSNLQVVETVCQWIEWIGSIQNSISLAASGGEYQVIECRGFHHGSVGFVSSRWVRITVAILRSVRAHGRQRRGPMETAGS